MPHPRFSAFALRLTTLLVLVASGAACAGERDDFGDQVLLNPQEFAGEQVTVRAEVTNYLSPLAFVIAGRVPTVTDDLVVIDAESREFGEGDVVKVTGTIDTFDAEEAAGDFDLSLDSGLYDRLDGELVLVAEEVERVDSDTLSAREE